MIPTNKTIRRILLVDEPGEDQAVLADVIKGAGYDLTEVCSKDDALALLKKMSVDLVVTELMMPDINGWDLLAEIKAKFPHIHVLVMTGQVSEAAEKILTNLKADGYLIKPVIPERVRVLFRALLDPQNLDRDAEVALVSLDDSRKEMIQALGDRGLHVFAFDDSKALERHLRVDVPDLIVVDTNAKAGIGLDLCRMVRFTRGTVYTPILLIVDKPSRTLVEKAIRLRINGILKRPVGPDELGNRAIGLLKQADSHKQLQRMRKKE
ncbi:MAG: DNA-binding response OmpR family regulator [Candidatus Latescibacterota bacterium]|jgi:DNA-binding response OmpR family regulator